MLPCISASFWSAAATSGWGGWRAQASPPKGTSFSKYPHPSGGCFLHTLGMIQLLLLPSSRLHFIFITSLNPTCSLPTSGFRGANWPNTEEPAVAGRHPFSLFTFELSKFIHLQRAQWRCAHLVCKSERERILQQPSACSVACLMSSFLASESLAVCLSG